MEKKQIINWNMNLYFTVFKHLERKYNSVVKERYLLLLLVIKCIFVHLFDMNIKQIEKFYIQIGTTMCHKINYVAYIRHQKRVQQFTIYISTLLKMQFLKLGGICCMGTY